LESFCPTPDIEENRKFHMELPKLTEQRHKLAKRSIAMGKDNHVKMK
jgi:hypothetical protein